MTISVVEMATIIMYKGALNNMALTEEEKKLYLSSGGVRNQADTSYDSVNSPLYSSERNVNYKTYFNKNIQAANIAKMAQKYLGNNPNLNGYQSQNGANSSNIALVNSLTNRLSQNAQEYADRENATTQSAYENYINDIASRDSYAMANLQNFTNYNEAQDFLKRNGYIDDNGNYLVDNDRANKITDVINNQFGTEGSGKRFVSTNDLGNGFASSEEWWENTKVTYRGDGSVSTDNEGRVRGLDWVRDEVNQVKKLFAAGNYRDSALCLKRDDGGKGNSYAYIYIGADNKIYNLTPEQYAKFAGRKTLLNGNKISDVSNVLPTAYVKR